MSVCTFFGHASGPVGEKATLLSKELFSVLTELIEHHGVDTFYIGTQGFFDFLCAATLFKLQQTYPHIRRHHVLAYMPRGESPFVDPEAYPTILPEGQELAHPTYAIVKRNEWMLKRAEHVVCYVNKCSRGNGAFRFWQKAMRKKKHVINLGDALYEE